jgi:exopolyphosphatase/guanosine-5'-triphosphate,3'-diphosphate pyrophosphatase
MIVASIDIGTNTVLLLVADVNLTTQQLIPFYEEQQMPRLGKGLQQNGKITVDKIDLLVQTLSGYRQIIESFNCEKIIISGTNALRIANNSKEIIRLVKNRLNFNINVISGNQEAEFAYLGATSGITDYGTALIIDIGGGSTELIFGNQNQLLYKKSFALGSVAVTEKYLHHSPPAKEEIRNLKYELQKTFSEINNKFSPDLVIGIAGTATTLACMIKGLKKFEREKIDGSLISQKELNGLVNRISELNPNEILNNYGEVIKGREDIITGGAIILSEIINLNGIDNLTVSSRGIRYGAIIAELFK